MKINPNYILYGCADKQDYEIIRDRRRAFNHRTWRVITALAAIYFFALFGSSFSVEEVAVNYILYAVMAVAMTIISVLFWTVVNRDNKCLMPLIYLSTLCMFWFGLVVGVIFSAEFLAVTFHVMLIAIPLLVADRPIRMSVLELIVAIVFVILCQYYKTGETKSLDIFNLVVFGVLGQFINYYMSQNRMQQFLAMYKYETSSITDGLTGMNNRHAYQQDMEKLEKRMPDTQVCIAFDVNGLKKTNDSLGHAAGDELLLGAAECITKTFDGCGKTYRIGGDEFVALIEADAKTLAERMEVFTNTVSAWKGVHIDSLSISVGYAAKADYPELSIIEIGRLADRLMYEQKANYYSSSENDRRKN